MELNVKHEWFFRKIVLKKDFCKQIMGFYNLLELDPDPDLMESRQRFWIRISNTVGSPELFILRFTIQNLHFITTDH